MVWTLGDCYGTVDFVCDKGIVAMLGSTDSLTLSFGSHLELTVQFQLDPRVRG